MILVQMNPMHQCAQSQSIPESDDRTQMDCFGTMMQLPRYPGLRVS